MTEDETNERLQYAQDIIDTVTQQRDGAQNTIAQLNARVKQLERQLADEKKKREGAEKALAEATKAPEPPPNANGHDAEAEAVAH